MSLRNDAPAGRRPRPEELASPRGGALGTGEVFGVIAMARDLRVECSCSPFGASAARVLPH